MEEKGILLNSFYEDNQNQTETVKNKQKNLQVLMSIDAKIVNKILVSQNQQNIKRIIYHTQVEFSPGIQGLVKY